MDLAKIRKKIDWYYRGKLIIVSVLFLFMIAFSVGAIVEVVKTVEWSAALTCIGYTGILVFVVIGAIYPIGKYNIRRELEKKDIVLLLDYLISYNGGDDKFYDALQVIFRTVSEMIHDNGIMNWSTAKDAEDVQNKAWNYLFNYLHVSQIWRINPQNVKEFASELKVEFDNNKIINGRLEEIAEKRFEKTISKKSHRFKALSLRWNVIVAAVCLAALLGLVVFKCILYYNPSLFSNEALQLLNQIGADVIAFVLAILTLKAEISSK